MAIVNNVVTAHHGKIKVETSKKGTHFLVQLPQFATLESNNPIQEDSVASSKALAAALLWK